MHRDDDEARGARIEALEREVRDARADAEAARAEAEAAKAQAAARPAPAKRERSSARDHGTPGWPERRRRQFRVVVAGLAALAYTIEATCVAVWGAHDEEGRVAGAALIGVALWMVITTAIAARVTRAPGVFNGSASTLIWAGVGAGLVAAAASPWIWAPVWLPASSVLPAQIVASCVAVALGALATAHLTTEAASSDAEGPD